MEEALLAEFQCPVCTNYMAPSIRQCVQGHLFCKCAMCRGEKSDDRCLALEKVHALLRFPCRYRDDGDGCDYAGKSKELLAHETLCQPVKCLLKFRDCRWQGKFADISEHCKLEHENDFFETDEIQLFTRSSRFLQCKIIIISAFDTLFLSVSTIEPDCFMEISVHHIGNPSITDQFSFYVETLFSYKKTTVKHKFCAKEENSLSLQNDEFITFSYYPGGLLRKGCRINCLLKIFRNGPDNDSTDKSDIS